MTEDLLSALRDAEVRPPRVDLHRAIRTGRRRRRLRHATMAGLAAVAVLATAVVVGVTAGQPKSMPADRTPSLPPVPLPTSTVAPPLGECTLSQDTTPYLSRHPWVVLDDTWRVAVHLDAPGTAPVEAVRYTEGRVERIKNVPSGFQVSDVNRAGVFTGVSLNNERGWVYRDGRFTRLTLPAGTDEIGLAGINDAGDLVGTVGKAGERRPRGVVWPGGHPDRPRVLDTPDGLGSTTYGIAWDGSVVGEVLDGDVVTPYLWHPDGTGAPLPLPAEWPTQEQAPWRQADGVRVGLRGLTGDWATGWNVRWNIRTGRADVINGMMGTGEADVYGRIYGLSDTADHHQVVWINGTLQPTPQQFEGWKAQFQYLRSDGRRMSGRSNSGAWVLWSCGD